MPAGGASLSDKFDKLSISATLLGSILGKCEARGNMLAAGSGERLHPLAARLNLAVTLSPYEPCEAYNSAKIFCLNPEPVR